jgi:hypothetical protein
MIVYGCFVKSGPEFALSREKRAFDLLVAKSLYSGKLAVGLTLTKSGHPPSESIFLQELI